MGAKFGYEAKLFYMEGGIGSGGSWVELTNIRDLSMPLEKTKADATTRANNGFKANLLGLIDAPISFESIWDPDNAGFEAFHDAFWNNHKIGLAIMDGAMATGTGLVADFGIAKFERNEELEEAIKASIEAVIVYSDDAPYWLEGGAIATGSDTY